MDWIVENYRDSNGKEPVADFVDALPLKTRAKVLRLIDLLGEYGVLFKEPYTRQLRGKIRELRIKDHHGAIRGFIFCIHRQAFYPATWLHKENR